MLLPPSDMRNGFAKPEGSKVMCVLLGSGDIGSEHARALWGSIVRAKGFHTALF